MGNKGTTLNYSSSEKVSFYFPQTHYYSGETIVGSLQIQNPSPANVLEGSLKFKGIEFARVGTNDPYSRIIVQKLLKYDHERNIRKEFPASKYCLSFSFVTKCVWPSSCEFNGEPQGRVKYSLTFRLVIVTEGREKSIKCKQQLFLYQNPVHMRTVIPKSLNFQSSLVQLNDEPFALQENSRYKLSLNQHELKFGKALQGFIKNVASNDSEISQKMRLKLIENLYIKSNGGYFFNSTVILKRKIILHKSEPFLMNFPIPKQLYSIAGKNILRFYTIQLTPSKKNQKIDILSFSFNIGLRLDFIQQPLQNFESSEDSNSFRIFLLKQENNNPQSSKESIEIKMMNVNN